MDAIAARGLTRDFGPRRAVDGLDLTVAGGEIFGVLGPNGAGKTTTLRMLSGVLAPTMGRAAVLGVEVTERPEAVKASIGYLPQGDVLYGDLSARENMEFAQGIYGVPRAARAGAVRSALDLLRVAELAGRRTRTLSGGERRLLALACVVALRQPLLVLDEPTAGLDPENRVRVWDALHELRAAGVTILVTTHYMDEADRCLRVGLIGHGRLLAKGTPEELRRAVNVQVVDVSGPSLRSAEVSAALPGVRVSARGARLRLAANAVDAGDISRRLAAAGIAADVVPGIIDLEDVFLALTSGPGAASRTGGVA